MDFNLKLSSVGEYGFYDHSLEILEAFKLFKGKKLLSYTLEQFSGGLDCSVCLIVFHFEDFYFYILRKEAGVLITRRYEQKVYVRPQEMDLAFFRQKYGIPEDEEIYDRYVDYTINKTVDNVILEIDTFKYENKFLEEERVNGIILKLGDSYFVPALSDYGSSRFGKESYYSTLEDYLNDEHDDPYLRKDLKSENMSEDSINAEIEQQKKRFRFVDLEQFLDNHANQQN